MPEKPFYQDTGWRAGFELPVCRLQTLFYPLLALGGRGSRRMAPSEHRAASFVRPQARSQRSLPLRQRLEIQKMLLGQKTKIANFSSHAQRNHWLDTIFLSALTTKVFRLSHFSTHIERGPDVIPHRHAK